jgi:hypothetical protein
MLNFDNHMYLFFFPEDNRRQLYFIIKFFEKSKQMYIIIIIIIINERFEYLIDKKYEHKILISQSIKFCKIIAHSHRYKQNSYNKMLFMTFIFC